MKEIIKSTVVSIVVNIATYSIYLVLMFFNIIHCYELTENYSGNLPIYIFFFAFPLVLMVLISLFIKFEKVHIITITIETFVLGIFSMIFSFELLNLNCSGVFVILQHIQYNIIQNNNEINVSLKIFSPILSAILYYCSIRFGNILKKFIRC